MGSRERVAELQERLDRKADPKTKDWWERYLRHTIPFRGVKMADIRAALHAWRRDALGGEELSLPDEKHLALVLMRERHAEDKLAGILYLQEVLLPAGALDWQLDLPRFAALFQEGHICEWNTCDWLCVKVLGPLVRMQGEPCARAISEWRKAGNLWQRRSSGVAFVNLAKNGDANFPGFTDMLLETCASTLQYSDRFAQTGTGWVLRELSVAEPDRVADFIENRIEQFSGEALRSATAKLPAETRSRVRQRHRDNRTLRLERPTGG